MLFDEYYKKAAAHPLNNVVGGGDPRIVGMASYYILKRYGISSCKNLLDVGCGIGRVLASFLENEQEIEFTLGVDMMSDAIDFCKSAILDPRSEFVTVTDRNEHYNSFLTETKDAELSWDKLTKKFEGKFDRIISFSVFTHLYEEDFARLLKHIKKMLSNDGVFVFTCFNLNANSNARIKSGKTLYKFPDGKYDKAGTFIGTASDPLAFIAFPEDMICEMVYSAGFDIVKKEYGGWSGLSGDVLQDVMICKHRVDM